MPLTASERLAAFLIAPDAVEAPKEMPDPASFLELVELHKLPLEEAIAVNGLGDDPLVASACLGPALAEDRGLHRRICAEFVALRERLDASGIPHVLLKAVHGVPYRSDNLDILIPESGLARTDAILSGLGYRRIRSYTDRYKMLYKKTSGGRLVGEVHVHRCVAWYSPFVEADAIFQGAVAGAEAGLCMPCTGVSLAIIGCHAIYEDTSVKLNELHKVRCLLNRGPVDWPALWQLAEHRGFEAGLALFFLILDRQYRRLVGRALLEDAVLEQSRQRLRRADGTRSFYARAVAGQDLPAPFVMSKYFARRCLFRVLTRNRTVPLRTKVWLAGRILKEGFKQVTRWVPKPLTVVAICGPDGSGKTTQAERLVSLLEDFELEPVHRWARIGDSALLNVLKWPLRGRVRGEVDAGGDSEQGVFRSRLARWLWPLVAVPDYLARQYLVILWAFVRGRVVVADRYHVDALVDLALRCGPEVMGKHWVICALGLLPRARPAFVLEVSAESMRRRRGEECVCALSERTIAYYREAAERMGARLLDGEANAETLAETIAKESLDRYYERL